VGSRSKINLSYIAGFLDGDGSLMLQISSRSEMKKRFISSTRETQRRIIKNLRFDPV